MGTTRTVVIHGDKRAEDFDRAIDVAQRLNEVEPQALIRIILNGGAVAGALGSGPVELVDGLSVQVCAVALSKQGFAHHELRPGVGVVPMAAHSIVKAQFEGAAYLRL